MTTDDHDERDCDPRITPEVDRRQPEIDKALAAIRELRKRTGRITVEELLSARDEGRPASASVIPRRIEAANRGSTGSCERDFRKRNATPSSASGSRSIKWCSASRGAAIGASLAISVPNPGRIREASLRLEQRNSHSRAVAPLSRFGKAVEAGGRRAHPQRRRQRHGKRGNHVNGLVQANRPLPLLTSRLRSL